ncbi:acyltransferase [Tumebacillus sp. ITR2]|uniref:Acyltransferase n=1 Tax=Tumebacillus amylolyticus TaxID=2801339 RepID=A0ABS1JAL9_9BACL|nr:acyltransferase [Tumebacillus amylolyticus]MBL0387285.1 acyltransferase [Tumebacillus amylolyticus]
MEKKVRLNEIGHLRSVAFLAVVTQHAIGMFTRTAGVNLSDLVVLSVLFNLVKFAVPMFVFITGLVIFYNYYEELKLGSYLYKRVREIIVPYLIWSVFYYMYWAYDAAGHSWREFPSILLTGSGYYHLWFVAMIFQFYLLYPLFRLLFKWLKSVMKSERIVIPFLLVLTGVFIVCTQFIVSHSGEWHSNIFGLRGMLNYVDRTFPVWYLYFVIGGVAAMSITKWRAWMEKLQSWNYAVFAVTLGWVTYQLASGIVPNAKPPHDVALWIGISNSFKASMILFTLSSFVLLYQIAMRLSAKRNLLTKLSDLIGKYSYGTFLAHAFLLDVVYKWVKPLPVLTHAWKAVVAMIVTTVLAVLVTMAISKIPFLGSLIVGTTGKRKKKVVVAEEAVKAGA